MAHRVQIRCNQCNLPFDGKKGARKHGQETGHQVQPAFLCLGCHRTFNTRKQYKNHLPPQHRPIFVAPVVTPSQITVTAPSSTIEGGPESVLGSPPLHTCGTCNFVFMDEILFNAHRQTCGKGISPGPEAVLAPQPALSDSTASVPTSAIPWQHATSTVGQTSKAHLVCHQCQQKFNGKKNMRRHGSESGHQWQPSVRCSACFNAFNTRMEFKAHVPQVSCLDAPMIRLLRSKSAVGAIPASTELQACQSIRDPPKLEGTAIVDANNDTNAKPCTTCGLAFTDVPSLSEHQRTCGRDSSVPQVALTLESGPLRRARRSWAYQKDPYQKP